MNRLPLYSWPETFSSIAAWPSIVVVAPLVGGLPLETMRLDLALQLFWALSPGARLGFEISTHVSGSTLW